ncbi:carbohydrate esterase family 4 protein [Scleroderma yunnanense]
MRFSSFCASWSALTALVTLLTIVPSVISQNHTDEESEAQITDPNLECTPYNYPPVTQAQAQFPPLWTVASILPNDAAAQAKYQSIQGQIPNIPPKGTQPQSLTGNFAGFSYPSDDPDCWWTATHCTTPKLAGIPSDTYFAPEPGTLGYGFDDGPYCGHNGFYDYLQSKDQTATMFYIGTNVMNVPLEAQRALADGHEICVHTWSHRYMTALTNEQAFAELYYSIQVIKLVIGVTPTCWRPPYGDVDDRIRAIAHALGLRNIVWQYDSSDWEGVANVTDANYQSLVDTAKSGAFDDVGTIFLTHELSNFTMSEAIKWYDTLASAFKYMVPVGVALNVSKPYVEDGYTLPTFAEYVNGTHVGSIVGIDSPNVTSETTTTTNGPASTSSSSASPHGTTSANAASGISFNGMNWLAVMAMLVGGVLSG